MISFINDYQEGCISEIINILNKNNYSAYSGYGEDSVCDYAKHLIKLELKRNDCDVHFIAGGTLTNKIVISSFLRSYECVICAESGHIATHETGAKVNSSLCARVTVQSHNTALNAMRSCQIEVE